MLAAVLPAPRAPRESSPHCTLTCKARIMAAVTRPAGTLTLGVETEPLSFRFSPALRITTEHPNRISAFSHPPILRPVAFVAIPHGRAVSITPIDLNAVASVTDAEEEADAHPICSPISSVGDLNGPCFQYSPTSPSILSPPDVALDEELCSPTSPDPQSLDHEEPVRYSPCSPGVERKQWLTMHVKSMPASGHYLRHPYRFEFTEMSD